MQIEKMNNERPAMSVSWLLSVTTQLREALDAIERGLFMEDTNKAYLTISSAHRIADGALNALEAVADGSMVLPSLLAGDQDLRTYNSDASIWSLPDGKFIVTNERTKPVPEATFLCIIALEGIGELPI